MHSRSQAGAATIEHAGLSLLVALALAGAVAAVASAPPEPGRELGSTLVRKLRCAAVGPGPCWQDPLTEAYGRPLAGAVRALAPAPIARPGGSGALLLPVDFRRCRSPSCAAPGSRPGLGVTADVLMDHRAEFLARAADRPVADLRDRGLDRSDPGAARNLAS